jgi:hypothetical protein
MWASVPELPAPPLACKRRVQILMKNDKFRKKSEFQFEEEEEEERR